jgi:alkyl sulfatase BDS1-like metallo-beta-lactamase superfamily hydrolase
VVQVVNHVVFAFPDNKEAKLLQADAMEQLGYQAESSIWRNNYLQGAKELREGVAQKGAAILASKDVIKAIATDLLFDYLAIRLNGPKSMSETITINIEFTDTDEQYYLTLNNGVLNYKRNGPAQDADIELVLSRSVFNEIILKEAILDQTVASGGIKVSGSLELLNKFFSYFDEFEFWFNLVTP